MTSLALGDREVGPSRPPAPKARTLAVAGLALVAGLAVGRFMTYDADPSPVAGPAAARTPEERIAALEEAVAADPDDLASWQDLGAAYVERSASTGDPAFYGPAERAFERAATLDPGNPETAVGRGSLALARHQFTDALVLGEEVRADNPSDPEALAVVVDAKVELGRYDAAATSLQELLDVQPGVAAHSRVSYLRQLHGDLPGALLAMQQAEAAAGGPSDSARVLTFQGDLHLERADAKAAERAYDEALRLSPGLALAEVGRARALAASGRRPEAVDRLGDLVDRLPLPGAAVLLGELLALEGRADEADTAFELVRAVTRLQTDAGAVADLELAVFEADHGDPATAVELARSAYADRPTVYAADALSWALHRAGRSAEALPLAEESLRLGTVDSTVRFHAASVLAAVGRPDRARAELERALAGNPWASFTHRDDVRALAGSLHLAVPAAWAD